jgi:predicted RNA-binding protein with PUA-like domain
MRYFLAKTEPQSYSAGQFSKDRRTTWDGVRNPQAVRAIREMQPGDRVFIYHSGGESAIVALATVAGAPVTDPSDSKLATVDLEYAGEITPPVTLRGVKDSGKFPDLALVKQSRLSTMAVPPEFAEWVWTRAKLVPPAWMG